MGGFAVARPKGSRTVLVRITYDDIGALVGIRGITARAYANRHEYNSRDLGSILRWVNERRQRQGLPLIGIPDGDNQTVSDDMPPPVETPLPADTTRRVLPGGLAYDPAIGEFRGFDDGGIR